ncbi:uncharacterized protein LOC113214523 [Frankliniella occidentalis]|uniref:Uncharacterized protein LOC113214523 n=1 Tax=Frankliniella occidentalis TaxID=133901 RepID=A0A9C6X5A6_FRAOC|nr:uncharacterized protein LOC113214523 [Frankliniella occidentalis]
MSRWDDADTANKASTQLTNLRQPEFLMTLLSLQDVLASTISLSRYLQKETIEMQQASDAVQDTISILEDKRRNSEEIFGVLFNTVSELCTKYDIQITLPRAAGRGRHPIQDKEAYYRQTIYNPMLENIIQDLQQRLNAEVLQCFDLNKLLPSEALNCDDNKAKQLLCKFAAKYSHLLETPEHILLQNLNAEWALWRAKWRREREKADGTPLPKSYVEALEFCDVELFPNIRALLLILLALPSSVATAGRSFSTLRRVKTWLRSTMTTSRLAGLALLSIHRDIPIDKSEVIRKFSEKNKTRQKRRSL